MRRFLPRSLLGQMLLAVALALLVAQAISAVLQYRAAEQRREMIAANALAFQLITEPRFDFRRRQGHGRDRAGWQRMRVQKTAERPVLAGEAREAEREEVLHSILTDQGVDPAELVVVVRRVADDAYVMGQLSDKERAEWNHGRLIVAAMRPAGETEWTVARWAVSEREPRQLGWLIGQTLLLYVLLVGGLAWLLRRITRPIAALTRRLEHFAATRELDGQLEPSGPDDTRRLIAAHNAMEARIAALLNEKDVMLGAIGHDLKTQIGRAHV